MKIYRYNLLHAHSQLINWFLALFFFLPSFLLVFNNSLYDFHYNWIIVYFHAIYFEPLFYTWITFCLYCDVVLFFIFIRFLLKVNNTTLLLVFPIVFAFGIIPFSFSNSLNSFFFKGDYGIRLTNKYIHGWMPIYYMLYYICFF